MASPSENRVEIVPEATAISEGTVESDNASLEPTDKLTKPVDGDASDAGRDGGVLRLEFSGFFVQDPAVHSVHDSAFMHAEMYSDLNKIAEILIDPIELELAEISGIECRSECVRWAIRRTCSIRDGIGFG